MDAPPFDRRTVPRHAVANPTVRPAALRRLIFEALPLLELRRGLPDVHFARGAAGEEPGRLWPVALRRPQRRQPQAGQAHV